MDVCVIGGLGDLGFAVSLAGSGTRVVLLNSSGAEAPPAEGPVDIVSLGGLYAPAHAHAPLQSLLTHHWLSTRRFGHVIFAAPFAAGYYASVARDLGLSHVGTGLWVAGGRCRATELKDRSEFPNGRTDIELEFLEREVLRRADGIIMRSLDEARRLDDAGMPVPARRVVWNRDGALIPMLSEALPHPPGPAGAARISVCMPTFNRPGMLTEAVQSLFDQTVDNFEVVLVDDGSTDPAALEVIDRLRAPFQDRNWTILCQENAGPAAARSAARRAAGGTHLLFMDDDNVAMANEIERFSVAARSGADILTCIPGQHPSTEMGPPPVAMLPCPDPRYPLAGVDWTPVGACAALAVMVNCLGDNNALFRAEAYDRLGGHKGDPDFVFEDFDLLSRAVAKGLRLEVVPEILFLYRRHRQSRSMGEHIYASHLKSLEPWFDLVSPALRPLLVHARRDWYERHRAACATETSP